MLDETHTPIPQGRLLLIPEVAEYLRISKPRVYELMADGSLASVRIGRSRRVTPAALAAFVDSLES